MSSMLDVQHYETVETLHRVKHWKFSAAQKEVWNKEAILEKTQTLAQQAEQARSEFVKYRSLEKKRLYDEERGQGGVKLGAINSVNYELAQLQQRLLEYEKHELDAKQQLADAQHALTQAKEHLSQTRRALMKYDSLGEDVRKGRASFVELKMEQEFEELRQPACPFQTQKG